MVVGKKQDPNDWNWGVVQGKMSLMTKVENLLTLDSELGAAAGLSLPASSTEA